MSSQQEAGSAEKAKPSLGGDLVIPVAAVVFTLYYFYSIIDSPWTAQVSAFFNGSILLLLCLILFVRLGLKVARGKASLNLGTLIQPLDVAPKRAVLFVLTVAYIACIDWAGFTITTFLFLTMGMLLLSGRERQNKLFIVALSASLAIGGFLLFVIAFERNFPEGPFEFAFEAMLSAIGGS
ncbi:MAG: tripartite tricarboxylate transporter TctB family protein [Pseudomonadota bacterium]